MDNELAQDFLELVVSGLRRRSVTTCSDWACSYRVMGAPYPGPWTFKYHPWLKEMHDSTAELNVGKKAAQMGFTETVLNRTLYNIDIKRQSCMYILPAKIPDAADFSQSRFDVALELSEHLQKLFTDTKNVGHKRAGSANLFIRGSKSRAGLKSVPAGFLVFDELEEMNLKNVPLAFERASGQRDKQVWMISTPSADEIGIDDYFRNTTQEEFFFRCPMCNKLINLDFPRNLVVPTDDILNKAINGCKLICHECKGTLNHWDKPNFLESGIWVPQHKDRDARGFSISQLYSPTVTPKELGIASIKAQNNPADEQEFYNSKLGKTCTPKGSRVSDEMINACRGQHSAGPVKSDQIITMGVDVGTHLHVEIDEWWFNTAFDSADVNVWARPKQLAHVRVKHFDNLDALMRDFNVTFCVIDANPERRKAYEFCMRHYGKARYCFYARGVYGKNMNTTGDFDPNVEPKVSVDRTSWLDMSLGRFHNSTIVLPHLIDTEYRLHIKTLVRRYQKDTDGNIIGTYIKNTNAPDHYAHSRNYAEIALPLALDQMGHVVQNIMKSPL